MMQIIRFCFGIAIITVASLIHNDASASILNVPFHTANVDFESVECVNVTDAGEIGFNQTNVGAFIPETISSLSPATGGIGPVEYVWIKRTPDVFSWTLIPGANEEEYSPGLITETTIFRRCARNVGCEDFEGESNDITITITEPDPLDVDEFNDCSVDGGIEYDVQIEGMEDYIDPCMTVEDTSGMLSMYVEVWLQNTDCGWHILPSSIEIEVDGTVYTAPGVIAEQTSPGGSIEKIYRVLVPGVSESICVVDAGYCDILSTALYIKRLSDENSSSSFKTFNRELHYTHSAWGTDDCVTDILLVGESLISRDIDLYIPIHEKDDVRTVRIDVEVTNDEGIVVATYSESFTEQNAGNEASLYAITVPDVSGDGTNIELTVCSPHGSGDSFGVGAVALTTAGGCVTCEMAEIKFIKSNPTCEEIDGGAITASVLDGTAPFTYLWSDGQTTQTAVGLSAGTYTVTVTDANGCVMEGSKTLSAPPCCNVTNAGEIGDNQENCGPFYPDLLFSIEPASGGIGPVEYQWIKSDTLTIPYEDDPYWSPIPGANGPTYDPGVVTESTYFVRCARNEGCDFFAGESNTISIIVHPEYELTVAEEHVVCKGSSTGSATVSVLGGTAPYTYLWSNGETAATAADLTAGVYTVTVTDANGCESTAEVEITEPAAALTSSITAESIACFGGTSSATVSAVGGTAPYTYLWSNGETAATAADLSAGVYTVTITDANGCESTAEVEITEPAAALTSSITAESIACFGGTSSATVSAVGGTAPYTYLWSNGETAATVTDLSAGVYTVTVTDANGCESTAEVEITEPAAALTGSITAESIACFGGTSSATVTALGGTAPYTYLWSNGETAATAADLTAGFYTVTVTDANGCVATAEVEITEPAAALTSSITAESIACFGGTSSATVSAVGGTAPYTYLWSNGETAATAADLSAGVYTVTVTDANGCVATAEVEITEPAAALTSSITAESIACFGGTSSATVTALGGTAPYTYLWSNGETAATAADLTAGVYTVTVTDANGCVATAEVEITEPAAALTSSITAESIACFGGTSSATVTAVGGTTPYTYLWSNGETAATATDLSAGVYTVTVADANGCESTAEVEITEPAAALTGSITAESIACFGGTSSATVTALGGTAPYTYLWSNGETAATATDLSAGVYTVTVTDANGCVATAEVEITEPAALSASFEIANTTCYGGDGGSATVLVTGGTAPYEYFWYYMEIGEPTIENVPSGTYPVVITDANGCELIAEAEVLDAEEMIASFSVEEVTCFGGMDGGATVTVSGGVEPYEYFWYYMEIGEPMLEDVPSGTYPVVITDANGCEIIAETEIGSPEPILISFESTATTCYGGEDGTATAIVSGGTAPYTYLWEDGQTTEMATGLSAGLHSVTITDANGCILTKEVTVDDAEPIEIELSTEEVTCHGGSNGAATVIASGGAGGYTYLWNDGQTSATAVDLSAGIYTVNITDANSCSIEVPVEVGEAAPLELSFEVNDVDCYGTSTGTAEVNVIGGTAPYEYFWYYMEIGTPMIDEVPAGAYTVVITDANGCTITGETIVGQPESALEADVLTEGASCEEGEDGSATVEVSGGTPGFTYLWNNGQTTATASGLSPGTYSVLVSDAMGCEFEVEGILITGGAPIAIEITTTDISCYGESSGSAVAEVIGGEAPYAYLWSDGQTSSSATDLEAGTYGVTVTDANGCTSESTDITIHEGDMLTLDIDTFIGEICDGMVWVTPSGGTAPYMYEWEHGADEADLTDLCEGVYFVTVTDANGCSVSSDVVIAYSLMGIQISLAPNPSIGATKLNIKTEAETGIYVDVLNAGGQEVKDDVFSGKTDESGIVEVELETSGLERGVYFVRVRTIYGAEVERLVVQ